MPLPELRCKEDHVLKSVVWILFNGKCGGKGWRGWGSWGERERKGREGKRVTDFVENIATPWLPMCSIDPPPLGGEGPTKYRVQWVNSCRGGNAQIPSLGDRLWCKFVRVSCERLWISSITWITLSARGPGLSKESESASGPLLDDDTPQLPLMWVWPSQGGDRLTAEPLCVREHGWSLPLSRGHAHSKTLLLPQRVGAVCAKLPSADGSVGYGLPHPDPSQGWISAQWLGLAFLWIHCFPSALFTSP